MKKRMVVIMLLLMIPFVISAGDRLKFEFQSGTVTMNTSIIDGTGISCNDVLGADYNVCAGAGSGADYSPVQNFSNMQCGTGEYAYSRLQNGSFLCRVDVSGSGGKQGGGLYLYNDSSTMYFNETLLNLTAWGVVDNGTFAYSDSVSTSNIWNQSGNQIYPALNDSNVVLNNNITVQHVVSDRFLFNSTYGFCRNATHVIFGELGGAGCI